MRWDRGIFDGSIYPEVYIHVQIGTVPQINNVGKTRINHPFGSGLYHLCMVIWEMVDSCFTNINGMK